LLCAQGARVEKTFFTPNKKKTNLRKFGVWESCQMTKSPLRVSLNTSFGKWNTCYTGQFFFSKSTLLHTQ
jgi:hypothetical protein